MHQCAFKEKRKIFNLAQIIFHKEITGNSYHKVLRLYLGHLYIIALTRINMVRCAIWYNFYNLKNVKNTHGGVLILVKLQAGLLRGHSQI